MTDPRTTEVPLNGDERPMLNAFLDAQRETLLWKCSGLSDDQMKQPAIAPFRMTLLGILRHLSEVEYFWFEYILTGRADRLGRYSGVMNPGQGAQAWTELDSAGTDEVLEAWRAAVVDAKTNAAGLSDMDTPAAKRWDGQPVTLRWITVHMIREYSRHCGHADLIREQIDGLVGE